MKKILRLMKLSMAGLVSAMVMTGVMANIPVIGKINTAVMVYAGVPGSVSPGVGGGGLTPDVPIIVAKDPIENVYPPTANNDLKYNGTAQALVTWAWEPSGSLAESGVTKKYSLKYSDDKDDYSVSIPTATASGTYKVYYGIDGGSNYQDFGFSETDFIEVTIAPAKVSETYSTLSTDNEKEEYGWCIDEEGKAVYLIYKIKASEEELKKYVYIAIFKGNTIVAPQGKDGKFTTVYKALKFNNDDSDVITAGEGQYILGFKIKETTAAPSNFEIKAVSTIEQGNDVNDE